MSTRSKIRHATTGTLLFAALSGYAAIGMAAGNAPEHAFKGATRLDDSQLPASAMRGTGLTGEFNPTALEAASVALTLSDGRVIQAQRQRVADDQGKGSKTWVGTFPSQPGSLLVMTTFRGATTGFVTYGAETFEIMPHKGGGHLLYKVDESKFPKSEQMLYPESTSQDVGTITDYGTGGASADATTSGFVHNLLVVYTPASKARYGQATLESMIQNAVQAANQAYQNSSIGITLNLVGLQEIQYSETGDMSTSVYDLRGTTDGKMDGVHAVRDSVGADIVSLISEDSSACGIAFTMRTESTSHASSAFNVVNSGCLSQHSLAHEVGHVQGNQHDRASSTNVGVFPYSYGLRVCDKTDGSGFRTVMAYPCNGAPRVTQFSNPNITYNGYPTGIAYESDPTNSADNSRSMNNTADTVAAFRGTTTTISATTPSAPSGASATAVAYNSVTVRWTDNSSNESGFKVERSSDGVNFTEIATLGAGTVSYADNGLSARTGYYYRVRAYNSSGNSNYSNSASVTTPDLPPPPPLAVSALNDGDGSATVEWVDGSSNETGFEIVRETWDSRRSAWKSATTVASVPSGIASIVDMSGAGTFRYSVRAVNNGGGSPYVGPAQTTVTGGTTSTTTRGKKPR